MKRPIAAPDGIRGAAHPTRVAIVDLGRATASGARRRLRSMCDVLGCLGCSIEVIETMESHRTRTPSSLRRVPAVVRGRSVPEALAWDAQSVRKAISLFEPEIVIAVTARAFAPTLIGPWRLYVDFVDRMSVNYAKRSHLTRRPDQKALFRALASRHHRFESKTAHGFDGAFAAGRLDAEALGVPWWPITSEPVTIDQSLTPRSDLCFVGTLDYLPNIEAVRFLHRLWPQLVETRPGISMLIAGARPSPEVASLSEQNGWTLVANFESVGDVLGQSRVAVAPLDAATGIQIKVLDAAAAGLPQVVSGAVAAGFDERFPFLIGTDTDSWIANISELLEQPGRAAVLATEAQAHALTDYGVTKIAEIARQILELP